ncbi:D-amino-acid transaminase [Pseudalkalibacillus berkeleyi]|uniref:D-alanine aminotransferase n=1 Tax=Pseudalkalibacillus berkeleyi TaxID=1069813 RepID=A0ABS9GWV1_9BACL|nr:D-amino-acid transaminase [Pseudalkalibacillus berkeleyi]MCF6137254.1 D-amino-acid transaminase [Pseudalkalibacillus berkeleyi]
MILVQDQLMDQSELHIGMEDRGYQFGDGIYEVIRIYKGHFFGIEEHLTRLERSAKELQMSLPYSIDLLKQRLIELAEVNSIHDGQVYLQITRGVAERTHHFPDNQKSMLVGYTKEAPRPLQKLRNGISVITTEDIRWLRCDIKSLNLLGNVLSKQKAKDAGCDEAILIREGTVTEGSSSNVFIVKDGVVKTHPANNFILNGITRNVLLHLAHEAGVEVVENTFDQSELMNADEVFISSTTMEITPVVSINDKTVSNGLPGAITQLLQAKFEQQIEKIQAVEN